MRLPLVQGTIKRRILANFRMDPAALEGVLPAPLRPKLHRGHAIVGVCLIRLEQMRPVGLPGFVGVSSENAAHRFAVEWTDASGGVEEGVFIPRRDTDSVINRLAGGRLFPGEQHPARFHVEDDTVCIDFSMKSLDGEVEIRLVGRAAESLPAGSCFESAEEASAFFEAGSLGYSLTRDEDRLDGLRLHMESWQTTPLAVTMVYSSYFQGLGRFPTGSVEFDHALVMRDLAHQWHPVEDLLLRAPRPAEAFAL